MAIIRHGITDAASACATISDSQPGVDAGIAGVGRGACGDIEAPLPGLVADPVRCELVDVVEVVEEILEVGVAVLDDRGLDVLENLTVDALWVVLGLEQEGRNRTEQNRLAYAGGAVLAEITGDLTRAHREADEHDVIERELLEQRVQVGSEGVVVKARRRPA